MRLLEIEQENSDLKTRLSETESENTGKDSEITKLRRRLQTIEKQNESLQNTNAVYQQERRTLELEVSFVETEYETYCGFGSFSQVLISISLAVAETLHLTSDIEACRRLRSGSTLTLFMPATRRSSLGDRAFPVAAARAWNTLLVSLRTASSLLTFRRELKTLLFNISFPDN